MKLLLDECVVRDLKRDLTGHEVSTVVEAGFGGLENGQLLRAAAGKYDVLITVDRNSHLNRHYLLRFKASRFRNPVSAFDYKGRAYLPRQLISFVPFVAKVASCRAYRGG